MRKVDICLPTRNSSGVILKLLDCLGRQIESTESRLLIADGASSDNTLDIIKAKIPSARIVSRRDKSPEQGTNMLFRYGARNIKILVGSDDWVCGGYVKAMLNASNACIEKGIKRFVLLPSRFINISGDKQRLSRIPLPLIRMMGIGRGIGWSVYDEGGVRLLSEMLVYASDYEYLLQCYLDGYHFEYVDCTYYHSKDGRSADSLLLGILEEYKIGWKKRGNKFGLESMASTVLLGIKAVMRLVMKYFKL